MGLIKDANKFNQIRQKIQDGSKKSNKFTDDRFIEFKPGNTYRFRLIGYTPDNSEREDFLASKYKHMVKVEDKWHGITCPTTLNPKTGFEKCPVCKKCRDLYKSGQNNPIDAELYKKYRRKFDGYAIVYVISDPVNEANNNTFKIIRYGTTIDKKLRKEIWGVVSSTPDESEETEVSTDSVGLDAINIVNGYDLIIEVVQKGEWPDYDCKFARKPTTLNIKEDEIIKQCEALNLDSELNVSTEAQLKEFYEKVVLMNASSDASESDESSINIDTLPENTKSSNKTDAKSDSNKKTTTTKAQVVKQNVVDELNIDDVEALLKELA